MLQKAAVTHVKCSLLIELSKIVAFFLRKCAIDNMAEAWFFFVPNFQTVFRHEHFFCKSIFGIQCTIMDSHEFCLVLCVWVESNEILPVFLSAYFALILFQLCSPVKAFDLDFCCAWSTTFQFLFNSPIFRWADIGTRVSEWLAAVLFSFFLPQNVDIRSRHFTNLWLYFMPYFYDFR